MEFDRTGPEGGLEIYTTVENGKASFECKVHLRKGIAEELLEEVSGEPPVQLKEAYLDISIWDRENRLVFCGNHPLWQDELARGMILHPHLWQGIEDPYLYRIRVSLMEKKDHVADMTETTLAFRTFCEIPGKGWFLNDRPFPVRAVGYDIPPIGCENGREKGNAVRVGIQKDLELIRDMGANTICPIGGKIDRKFCQLCDEMGLLLWWQDRNEKTVGVPRFYGTEDSLLTLHGHTPTEQYYAHKACWSKTPFVYISMDSLEFQKNGNVQVTVYSNQKKVALYVDGILFEFLMAGPEFVFTDIPVKHLPMLLAAQAGEAGMSVTAYPVHKIYTK